MKNLIILIIIIIGLLIGITIENRFDITTMLFDYELNSQNRLNSTEKKIKYWIAPMNQNYRRNEPGKSPMGMDLVPVYEGDDDIDKDITIIKISPKVINNLGVRTTKVERGPLWKRISTIGYISYDETRINHIHTRTEGWIEKLQVHAKGEKVKRGQLLFEIYSPPLVNAQEEYLQALASGNKRLVSASQKKLSALGVSKSQIYTLEKDKKITRNILFYAKQSGIIVNLGVREGMYIKPETQVISIANLDTIWLLAEVFEQQASWVEEGQNAEVKLPSMPGVVWKGMVEYIYPELDPVTRTLQVRLRFDNSGDKLKPNMYSRVIIFAGKKEDVISIPREALIRDSIKDRVIKSLGGGQFQAQEVIAGMESGDWIEIISGLNENDNIVISSQFLIDSESNLKANLNRMQAIEHDMSDYSIEQSEMDKR